jgi:ferredoxin
MNSNELKSAARKFGADLIGIAPVSRFSTLPPEKNPLSIAPECKSVIVLGRRILRGSLRGVEEGTNFGSTYGFFGYRHLEDNYLSQSSYDLTCWIEEHNFEAVPLFGYSEEGMPKAAPVEPGKPAPNVYVDYEFAAVAAGLAEMSLGGFVLTPEYGHRQRFALILTDAELEPDPLLSKTLCADCKACAEACPLGAIDMSKSQKFGPAGKETAVAKIDYSVCAQCKNGAAGAPGRGCKPDRLAAACARACLVHLEGKGALCRKFENVFRKRKPWALDPLSRNIAGAKGAGSVKFGCGGQVGTN